MDARRQRRADGRVQMLHVRQTEHPGIRGLLQFESKISQAAAD